MYASKVIQFDPGQETLMTERIPKNRCQKRWPLHQKTRITKQITQPICTTTAIPQVLDLENLTSEKPKGNVEEICATQL